MKNMKKFAAVMAAAAMVTSTGMTAAAYEYVGPQGDVTGSDALAQEAKENGHTTFSIVEAEKDPSNVSFTVPLYVTMAVVNGDTDVKTPTNYEIRNTSAFIDGNDDPFDIAVTSMTFEKLVGSTYNTATTPTGAKEIKLTIGDVVMPEVTNEGELKEVKLTDTKNAFFDPAATGKPAANGQPALQGEYTRISATAGENVLPLAITGTLGAAPNIGTNVGAVPQFKVKYVVSACDDDGLLLPVYAGDDKNAAGLGFIANPKASN